MSVTERLESYGTFSPAAIESAAELDGYLKSFDDYTSFFVSVGVPEEPTRFTPQAGSSIEVVHIRPPDVEYDPTKARVYHFPFACPADSNMLYHVAALQRAAPDEQLIAFPRWSGRGYSSGLLSRNQRAQVASGNFRPLVEGSMQYLASQGIEQVDLIGYSAGASQVPEHMAHAEKYDHLVTRAVSMDPPDMLQWQPPHKLAKAFLATDESLNAYVQANENPLYNAARHDAAGRVNYLQCFMRASSIALGLGLARGGFQDRADAALIQNPESTLHIIRGQESELAVDAIASQVVARLQAAHPDRVVDLVVPGVRHMWVNDLSLQHAALLTALPKHV